MRNDSAAFLNTHTQNRAHVRCVNTQREHTRRVHITHTVGKEWAVDVAAAAAAAAPVGCDDNGGLTHIAKLMVFVAGESAAAVYLGRAAVA